MSLFNYYTNQSFFYKNIDFDYSFIIKKKSL